MVRIRAALDDSRHALAKTFANLGQHGSAATVLHHVMQRRRNGLVFITARFQDQRRDAQHMRDVRDFALLPSLAAVFSSGKNQCIFETGS